MRPAFAGHTIASAIFFATVLVWIALEIRQGLNRRAGATTTDRGSLNLLRALGFGGALLGALALRVQAAAFTYSTVVIAISLVIMWAGIGLRWWSFHTLGHYFTFQVMTSKDQPVINTGPYRLVRHPGYLALLLILFGIGLSYGNWLSLVALLLPMLAGLVNRIRVEEGALASTLGDRYTSYAAGRKRLVPYVW